MIRIPMSLRWKISPLLVLGAVLALTSCEMPGLTDGAADELSSEQAAIVARQFAVGLSNGVSDAQPLIAAAALRAGGVAPISATLVNVPISQRTNCTSGGYINVTGSMTGSISDNGTGVLSLGITETINDWECAGGLTLNGDPYITAAGTFSFLSGVLSSPASLSMGGAFRWTGNGAGSCTLQLTTLIYSNGTGRTSGQVCGQGVNETF